MSENFVEELYTKDGFGHELNIGDKVIAATTIIQSPALKIGIIKSISKGKPYKIHDSNTDTWYNIAKWRIEWTEYPFGTYKNIIINESVVNGLNLYKID